MVGPDRAILSGESYGIEPGHGGSLAGRQVVVVGAGRVGRLVVRALPEGWTITVVDPNRDKLALLPDSHHGTQVRQVHGDATSRLVLEQAGMGPEVVAVIVTGGDAVNREVARLSRQDLGVEELVVLLDDDAGIGTIGLSHREVVQRYKATALIVLNRLTGVESRGIAVGLGQGEIREVTVHEGSAAAGRALAEIQPSHWLVAAVYRDDRLIVPTGETKLQTGDRVILVGEPEVIEKVGRFVRGGEPVFPSQYGQLIGLLDGPEDEATWLAEHSQAEGLVQVARARLEPAPGQAGVPPGLVADNIGCLVTAAEPVSFWARVGLTRSTRDRLLGVARVPFLVARGTFPYRRILLAVSTEIGAQATASAAIDLARQMEASLTVLTVVPPTLADENGEHEQLRDIPRRIGALARVHGVEVERKVLEGNPIEVIRKEAARFDLLVLGHTTRKRNTLITPDISLWLLHDAPCSTLFVPDVAVPVRP